MREAMYGIAVRRTSLRCCRTDLGIEPIGLLGSNCGNDGIPVSVLRSSRFSSAARLLRRLPRVLLGGRRRPTAVAPLGGRREWAIIDRESTQLRETRGRGRPVREPRPRRQFRRALGDRVATYQSGDGLVRASGRSGDALAGRPHCPLLVAIDVLATEQQRVGRTGVLTRAALAQNIPNRRVAKRRWVPANAGRG